MLKLIRDIHFEKFHVNASVSQLMQVCSNSKICILTNYNCGSKGWNPLKKTLLKCGQKYVETYSSSNPAARNPEEMAQNTITQQSV